MEIKKKRKKNEKKNGGSQNWQLGLTEGESTATPL